MFLQRRKNHEIVIAENSPSQPEDNPAGLVPAAQRRSWKLWINSATGQIYRRINPRVNAWIEQLPFSHWFSSGNVLPNGVTDNTEDIYRAGKVTIGSTTLPDATFTLYGGLATKPFTINSVVGTANALAIGNNTFVRVTSAMTTLNGITAGFDGQHLALVNIGIGSPYLITNESLSAVAGNRIVTGTNGQIEIGVGAMALFVYDGLSARWRMLNAPLIVDTVIIATTQTLPIANRLHVILNNGATNITLTLPSTFGNCYRFSRNSTSTGTVTLQGSAGQIQALNGTIGATTSLGIHSATGAGLNHNFTFDGTNWMRI